MTYQYDFTAFSEADLLGAGDTNLGCGDTFVMPVRATTCISVTDNDPYLSGDAYCNENADDTYGQHASIEGPNGEVGNGGQIYAESYYWVKDQWGNKYVMLEIEQEGTNDDYFTFHSGYGTPPAGAQLTIVSQGNVTGNWVDYKCLGAGEKLDPPATIKGRLFVDSDHDNTELNADGGWEAGFKGATIELLDAHGNVVATTTTDAHGNYTFEGVDAGDYSIRFEEPDGYDFVKKDVGSTRTDSDADQTTGQTKSFSVSAGQTLCNIDAGVKEEPTGTITGTVFCDTDCDGKSAEITTIPGATITVEAEDMQRCYFSVVDGANASGGKLVKLQTTKYAGDGYLRTHFSGESGTYDVKIAVQDENDGQSIIKLVVDGRVVDAIRLDRDSDGGGSNNGTFSTYVIEDVNIHAGSEIKLWADGDCAEFVRIDKIDFVGQDTVTTTAEPTKAGVRIELLDTDGKVLAATFTDDDGNYTFDDVPAGEYTIRGRAPDGTEFTIPNVGGNTHDDIDSDVNADGVSDTITVSANSTTDVDLGVCDIKEGSLSGRFFFDANRNNVDDGEAGVQGVLVELLDADGTGTGITVLTGADGSYSFTGLEPGTYGVKFTDAVSGAELVTPNVGGDDAIDSDAIDLGGNMSQVLGIVVTAGEDTPDNDAGVKAIPGSLSGTYFCDENENNIDDAGDTDVAGKTVTLLNADKTPATDIDGNPVAPQQTDAQGNYRFTNLAAGAYVVAFALPTAVEGKEFVSPNVGDDANDSDVIAPAVGETAPVLVVAGEETTDVDAGIVDINDAPTADDDAGMVCVGETTTIDLLDGDTDPEGDTLTVLTISDADETVGIDGTLTLASGATATLNADGTVSIDASGAAPDLLIGDTLEDEFIYIVSDGDLTDEGSVDLTLKGALNTYATLSADLGDAGCVVGELFFDNSAGGEFYTLEVTDVEFGTTRLGEYFSNSDPLDLVFCLSIATPIAGTPDTNEFTLSILDAASFSAASTGAVQFTGPDFGINPENVDNVNWLLNEADDLLTAGYTEGEIQVAIWNLLDGGADSRLTSAFLADYFSSNAEFGDAADAEVLTQLALANDGFVAQSGDVVAVLFDPKDDGVQPLVAAIEFDVLKENCDVFML